MLTKELEQSDWYRDLPFTRKPSVQLIRPELAVGITDTTDSLNDHTFITAMGLLRVGTDTILQNIEESSENNTENSVSEKLNRLLRM